MEACIVPEGYSASSTDCDDNSSSTYPGAAYNEATPLNEECLTDADGDGYGLGVVGFYDATWDKNTDGCITIEIYDSWGDGCSGYVDFYVDGAYYNSYQGPSFGTEESYEDCDVNGSLSVGWTEATSYNNECSFSLFDAGGNELYASASGPSDTVPGGGTDSDDSDATVQ